MVVDTFIRRPILASVCSLVIIIGGLIVIPSLPIAQFPQLAPPTVQVAAFYQGASAEVVESAVTIPIEQALNGVEGLNEIWRFEMGEGGVSKLRLYCFNPDVLVQVASELGLPVLNRPYRSWPYSEAGPPMRPVTP